MCKGLDASLFMTRSMLKSYMHQAFAFSTTACERHKARHWTGEKKTRRRTSRTCSYARAESSLNLSHQAIEFVRKAHTNSMRDIKELVLDSGMIVLVRYASGDSRLFYLHGNGFLAQARATLAIAFSGGCVAALHDASVEASKFLEFSFSNLDFHSRTRIIMDDIAFKKSSMEW